MNRDKQTGFRRILGDQRGIASMVGAVGIMLLLGMAALSVDAGYVFVVWNKLQAATEAAAVAGAKDIGSGGTPIATATLYSAVTGTTPNKNTIEGITTVMAAGYPALHCFTTGPACTTIQSPATSANGIQVVEKATVPLFFARMVGIPSVHIQAGAVALAAGEGLPPYNVIFIVDATASMGSNDAKCSATRIKCAVQGFEVMLNSLWPCVFSPTNPNASCVAAGAQPLDEAGLLQFPGLQTAPTGGNCGSLSTTPYAGITGKTNNTTKAPSTALHFAATPSFNTGSSALVTDTTHPTYIQKGTYISSTTGTTALMKVAPTSGDTVASGDTIAVWPPIYEVMPLSSDYRTSDTAATLNASSNLVKCVQSLGAPGGYGTFYADAINAAQSILEANARTGAQNVIILLSDGDASATTANMVDQAGVSTASNECKAAVTAAQNAAAAGTWVYAIAYGATPSGTCSTDTGTYKNACTVMGLIANVPSGGSYINDPTRFYSDDANGCQSTAHPSITSISAIFQNVTYSLTKTRLLPAACLKSPVPASC